MLDIEEKQLTEQNTELTTGNEKLNNENTDLAAKIQLLEKRIRVNNLLKEIDVEEMQLIANANKTIKRAFEDMVTKWSVIMEQK